MSIENENRESRDPVVAQQIKDLLLQQGINLGEKTPKTYAELTAYVARLQKSLIQEQKILTQMSTGEFFVQGEQKQKQAFQSEQVRQERRKKEQKEIKELEYQLSSSRGDTKVARQSSNRGMVSRRNFLRQAFLGAAGVAVGAYGFKEFFGSESTSTTEKDVARKVPTNDVETASYTINEAGMDQYSVEMRERMKAYITDARDTLVSIARGVNPEIALENPYVVSALYYSDEYVQQKSQEAITPQGIIIREIATYVTPEIRKKYITYLDGLFTDSRHLLHGETKPLARFNFGVGEDNHTDAIDLFTTEKSPIAAIAGGVVVLAEQGWNEHDSLSTSSFKGGNTVIVYNPIQNRFYRYAHLGVVQVKTGDKITAGTQLGTVGHTGLNANKAGHGNHLHLEINVYSQDTAQVHAMRDKDIERILQ